MNSTENDDSKWMGESTWVLQRIMQDTGRDAVDAEKLRRSLIKLHPSLRPVLLEWWGSGQIDLEHEIQGWSIRRILKERPITRSVTEAFTWLDGLLKYPDETLKLIAEPVDKIYFSESAVKAGIKRSSH